jgi:hypothetical protein
MVYPTPTARKGETFMLFAFPTGVQGNVINDGVNELIIPNYKQTWDDIRKIADAPEVTRSLSFKSREYKAGLGGNGAAGRSWIAPLRAFPRHGARHCGAWEPHTNN